MTTKQDTRARAVAYARGCWNQLEDGELFDKRHVESAWYAGYEAARRDIRKILEKNLGKPTDYMGFREFVKPRRG